MWKPQPFFHANMFMCLIPNHDIIWHQLYETHHIDFLRQILVSPPDPILIHSIHEWSIEITLLKQFSKCEFCSMMVCQFFKMRLFKMFIISLSILQSLWVKSIFWLSLVKHLGRGTWICFCYNIKAFLAYSPVFFPSANHLIPLIVNDIKQCGSTNWRTDALKFNSECSVHFFNASCYYE